MRKIVPALFLLALPCAAQIPPGYYDTAAGLTGEPMRSALNAIIHTHTELQYSALWTAFATTDRKPDGTVWDIYSDVPDGTPDYTYAFVVDQCGTYDSEGDCFNREHSFPQSWFASAGPMRTDLHHVYPTDGWVNNQRGNFPLGRVGVAAYSSSNGTQRGPCDWPGCSGTVWEPIDAYKGDLARSQLYMLTCYLTECAGWTSSVLTGDQFVAWQESLLFAWHAQDPVDQKEIDRNNSIYPLQGNRNPYIDHPEWVQRIWGPTASINEAVSPAFTISTTAAGFHLNFRYNAMPGVLRVQDATGRILLTRSLRTDQSEVDFAAASGVYVVSISEGDLFHSERVFWPGY